MKIHRTLIGILFGLAVSLAANAQIPPPADPEEVLSKAYTGKSYSPYADRGFPTMPLWGDTHLHTANSFDAGAFGARLLPDDAFRFARGGQVTSSTGVPARLSRPLDWLVVADHSDNMGFFPDLYSGKQNIVSKPQGRDLPLRAGAASPSFMVYALRDPIGANLDRIQIVKGWSDDRGNTGEKVYDVVWSGDRSPGGDGKLAPVGNTVDADRATYSNTIGAPELGTVWTDPDFDPEQRAFYYVRVLEIPTPRWSTYDAFRFGVEIPEGAPVSTQERAYTSPIWYTP